VIFNHPHLGTENAILHSRFLAHLFHASTKRWMKHNGALGSMNDGHGLVLLRRDKFIPPPLPPHNNKNAVGDGKRTYYSLRRHQSGQSFANLRHVHGCGDGGSETFIFGRACDYQDSLDNCISLLLPWEHNVLGNDIHFSVDGMMKSVIYVPPLNLWRPKLWLVVALKK
jgi:hypothetical protein